MCSKHYKAWHRGTFDPETGEDRRRAINGLPFEERLARHLEVGDCWEWMGALTKGYGSIRLSNPNRHCLVHRWVWEQLVGAIPEGLELDHLCRNRRCCNPDHLEPVTQKTNQERGAMNWTTGPCIRSHLPSERRRSKGGQTYCKACRAEYRARRRLDIKEVK